MNTKKTKLPKRWSGSPSHHKMPEGLFAGGLTNPEYQRILGQIAARWPHVEEAMIRVFNDLLGGKQSGIPTREVYRSIINAQIRIQIMRNLLEGTRYNAKRGPEYDEVIDDFAALNGLRNDYLHGLWSTHQDGRVFLAPASIDRFWYLDSREVKVTELENVFWRMATLERKIYDLTMRNSEERLGRTPDTLPQKPPPKHEKG